MARHSRGAVDRVPVSVRWLFWDVDPAGLRWDEHASYIIPRVLEFGGLAEVRWVMTRYGLPRIHAFLKDEGHPELTLRTLAFWRAVFAAEGETWQDRRASRTPSSAPWIA